jgi:lycopene cyclase CruP
MCIALEPVEAEDSCAHGQVGDASASQSPLSFGGFGNMLRHLQRLSTGLDAALQQDRLSKQALRLLQARQHP